MRRLALTMTAALIYVLGVFPVNAAGVTAKFENQPLPAALKSLEQMTGKRFAYARKFVDRASPISGDFKGQSLGRVLDRLLRPNGLVAVNGKGDLMVIAPVTSDVGMAKLGGRAIRTMDRLEPKLETVDAGNGFPRVPEWTASDDRQLFFAIADLATAVTYFDDLSARPGNNDSRRAIELMLASPDPDVRAGAALAFGYWRVGMASSWQRGRNRFAQLEDPRLLDLPRRAFSDENAIVRATWIFTLSGNDMMIPVGTRRDLIPAIEKGTRDKSPLVRAAAAGAVGRARRFGVDPAILKPLASDKSAAVRLVAKLAAIRVGDHPSREEFAKLMDDTNPIVRTFFLPLARDNYRGNPSDLAAAGNAQKEDPWFAKVFDVLFAASSRNSWNRAGGRWGGRGRGRQPHKPQFPLAKAIELINSQEPSVHIAGLVAVALSFSGDTENVIPQPDNPLPENLMPTLTSLAKSNSLWSRAFAAFGSAQAFALRLSDARKAEMLELYKQSLKSNDSVLQLSALLGTIMLDRETAGNAVAEELRSIINDTSMDLNYPAAAMASHALGSGLPLDQALGLLRQRVAAEPKLEPARVTPVLLAVTRRREMRVMGRGRTPRGQIPTYHKRVLDIVLGSHDTAIQLAFLRISRDWLWRDREGLIMGRVLNESAPKVLEYLSTTRPISYRFNTLDGIERIHGRLNELLTSGDALRKQQTISAYAGMLATREFYMRLRTDEKSTALRKAANDLIATMLQESFKTDAGRTAGLDLLNSVVSPQTSMTSQWDVIPQPCIDALIKSLALVTDAKHHGSATSILNQLLQKARISPQQDLRPDDIPGREDMANAAWDIARYPKLDAAVAKAKAELLAKGRAVDKITLRIALARIGDVEMARAIAGELVQGNVPHVETPAAIRAATLADGKDGDAFANCLLALFKGERAEGCPAIRGAALEKLRSSTTRRSALTNAFATLVANDEFEYVHRFVQIAEEDRAGVQQGRQAPWLPKLAEIGLAVANNEDAPSHARQSGYRLFTVAAGPAAADKSQEIVLDPQAPTFLRVAAAEHLNETAPKTDVYKKLGAQIAELPRELRSKLAVAATRNMDNDGAPEFVATVINAMVKDQRPDMGLLWQIGRQLRTNPDPRIIKALDPLKKDRRFGRMVEGMLRRLQPRDADGERPAVAKAPAQTPAVATIKLKTPEVRCVARADDGTLLCAEAAGEISVHSAAGKELRRLKGHDGVVYCCAISADGKIAASGGRDRDVRVWDVAAGKELRSCTGHTKSVQGIDLSADGSVMASTGLDATVRIWEVSTGNLIRKLDDPEKGCRTVAFSPDGSKVAAAGLDRTIFVWDVSEGILLHSLKGHTFSIRDVAFSNDGLRLASASDDMTIKIWDLASGKTIKTFTGHDSLVTSLSFLPDNKRLLSAGQDGKCLLWSLETAKPPTKVADGLQGLWSLALSKDGKLVVLAGRSGDVLSFRVP